MAVNRAMASDALSQRVMTIAKIPTSSLKRSVNACSSTDESLA